MVLSGAGVSILPHAGLGVRYCMRIFVSCLQETHKPASHSSQFWESYFKNGIQEAGHEWVEAEGIDWLSGLTHSQRDEQGQWLEHTWSRAVSLIARQHQLKPVHLFLSYLFPNQIEPEAITEIKALGIPCVNFFCDNVREFTEVPAEFRCFDLHWVPEFKAIEMYERANLNFIHAPMPVWVHPSQRTCQHAEKYGVTFIGSRDEQRDALFAQVLKLGVSLELRGSGWGRDNARATYNRKGRRNPWQIAMNQADFLRNYGAQDWFRKIGSKFRPAISDEVFAASVGEKPDAEQYIEITQQSVITLGVNRYPSFRRPFSRPDTYSRLRDLEAPMMGACYLTEWTKGLDLLYEIGEEIETYTTAEEMADKIRALKADPLKRRRLRCEGSRRALADHSIPKSLSRIAERLGLN